MGCMCHLLRTYERIGLKRGSSHVDWGGVGGRREKRLQRASVGASRRKIGPVPNLCILLSLSILSRVTAISASPLADFYRRSHRHLSCLSIEPLAAIPLGHPATAAITCIYIIYVLTKADSLAHDRLWSLIANTHPTNSHKIFEGALFHLQNTLEPVRKKAPPILILPSVSANFTP